MVTVEVTCADGKTLEEFQRLLAARQTYLNETAEDSCAAIAIDALKSIRATTKKATKSTVVKDVNVVRTNALYPSFKTVGKVKKFCLRETGSKKEYKGTEQVVQTDRNVKASECAVFSFTMNLRNGQRKYLIVSPSEAKALKWAKEKKKKFALAYSGLARRALTVLMMKTATIKDTKDTTSPEVETVASKNTNKTELKSGGMLNATYSLLLEDNLDYASGAVEGGEMGVNIALQKAMNKVASVINHKCQNLLLFEELPTPFPEVKQRK